MAKKKNSKPRGFTSQTAYKFIRLAALLLPAASEVMSSHSNQGKLQNILRMYTGFHIGTGTFNWRDLQAGYMPVLGATIATYGIPKLAGLIRSLKV